MELIDKTALIAELEKRIAEGEKVAKELPSSAIMGLIQAYKNTLSFINTLEVKEVEESSKDLEDEATKYAQDKYMPVQTAEAFRAGYNKCRQEMMNSAIEREVKEDAGGYPYIDATELYDYENDKPLAKAGDKVKVLIVKDK